MSLIKGEPDDTPEKPRGRIRNTRKLLLTAALIMSVFLLGSSLVTATLIPPEALVKGGGGRKPRLGLLGPRPRDFPDQPVLW
jgi:hypothetical protein